MGGEICLCRLKTQNHVRYLNIFQMHVLLVHHNLFTNGQYIFVQRRVPMNVFNDILSKCLWGHDLQKINLLFIIYHYNTKFFH